MTKLSNRLETEAAAEAVWGVVGDLAGAKAWIPGVADVKVEGSTRVCTFADGNVQHEEIADYSPEARSYRYSIKGGPLPLKSNRGKLEVREQDGGAVLVWEAEIEAQDPSQEGQIAGMLDGMYKQVLGGLKELVEQKNGRS